MLLRLRKDGGYSECNAPDELVGKGRCIHVLGGEGEENLEIQHLSRGLYVVDIPEKTDKKLDYKSTFKKFFNQLPTINKSSKEKILKELNNI